MVFQKYMLLLTNGLGCYNAVFSVV